ncbi:peptidase U32 family protein [Paenibacillus xylaniclasticus]|uniref:peptidase U32 family protein n=1 Tax=Paenibacillus xylaniclasticus TaxID=588083 RepID=UPI000FD77253|nr:MULTISPECIES: peptidase U32 family protein [Paenibacillus]GFN33569.1 putative protease YrrN [Paenibacillus curdlanolyticus]
MTVYRPELLTTASSLEELRMLMEAGADAFVVGESRFAARLPGEFSLEQIARAVELAKQSPREVKIYVSMNNIFDNALLDAIPGYVTELARIGVTAVVFGDPAVLMAVRQYAPALQLHWNAEMTSTNYETANFWGRRGASRFVCARELNMEQIVGMKQHTKLELQVQVHGMTNIYHSKRSLVQSYMDYKQHSIDEGKSGQNAGMYLMEAERPDDRYPIYEDANGTHIMSPDDLCMIENLHELMEAEIDSFKIEGLLKSTEYNVTVVRAYRAAIDAYCSSPQDYRFRDEWLESIQAKQEPGRELSYGFFYKEQVY